MKRILHAIYVGLAFLFLGMGGLGILLPVLPTAPFLLAAACLFAKGSQRFHKWFMSTDLYKKYIDQAVHKKAMTGKAKRNMLIMLGIIFVIGILASPVYAKIVIAVVAALHFYYFLFRIKTISPQEEV